MKSDAPNPLTPLEVGDFCKSHPGWAVDPKSGALHRTWDFSTFVVGIHFVDKVAQLAEAANHHPDIDIRWKKVTLSFITHDAGNRVTALDTRLAHECELVAKANP